MKKIAKAVLYDGYQGSLATVDVYYFSADGSLWFSHTEEGYRWPVNHETYHFESDAQDFVNNHLPQQSNVKMLWSMI